MRRCSPPVSPTALRAELMRLVNVESDTIRPSQTAAKRSSLERTRSRFFAGSAIRSNTWGSSATCSEPRLKLAAFGVKPMTFKEKLRQEDPLKVGFGALLGRWRAGCGTMRISP